MGISFFFDESGHSGDMVSSGAAYDFLDQPYFVLASVGVENEAMLVEQVNALRSAHRIPDGELRSKSRPLQRRPKFIADLLHLVCDQKLPFFIEVVDKKFFMYAHMVNSQLLPPVMGYKDGPGLHFIKNHLVDFLYNEITDHVLDRYVAACMDPSDESLMSAFGSQLLFTADMSATSDAQVIRECMGRMVIDAMEEYGEVRKKNPEAYFRFLPSPDLNKHGKPVWMLPNLSSFTNIYARINRLRKGRVAGVRLIHDDQIEFEEILHTSKRAAESIKDHNINPFTPHSDFLFTESASLTFVKSHESVGIQLADMLAGTVMRFYRDRMRDDGKSTAPEIECAVNRLVQSFDAATGVGVNQIVPLGDVISSGK